MRCQQCGEHEATVHEVRVNDHGERVEAHLCDQCASQVGYSDLTAVAAQGPLKVTASVRVSGPKGPVTCPACSMTFEQFRACEQLGCAECYHTFEKDISPLIERTHEGATHHVGKVPSRLGGPQRSTPAAEVLAERIAHLRAQLQKAIGAEQYERAASLRDEIGRIEQGSGEAAT